MAFNLADYNSALRYKALGTRTWAANGNTDTVTDANVHANSIIVFNPTSAIAGRWRVAVSEGSFTVTSSDPETTSVTYNYIIL